MVNGLSPVPISHLPPCYPAARTANTCQVQASQQSKWQNKLAATKRSMLQVHVLNSRQRHSMFGTAWCLLTCSCPVTAYRVVESSDWFMLLNCDKYVQAGSSHVCRGLTSHSTLCRSFWGQFLQARWPNQQRQSTEGSQLATEIGFNPTRTTPPCYNMARLITG